MRIAASTLSLFLYSGFALFVLSEIAAAQSQTALASTTPEDKLLRTLLIHPNTTPSNPLALVASISSSLASLCSGTPCTQVDLIATPDYALYDMPSPSDQAIQLSCSGSLCTALPAGASSAAIVQAINSIQTLAATYTVPIYLASVLEFVNVNDQRFVNSNAYFNSILFIDRLGIIRRVRREIARGGNQSWLSCGGLSGTTYEVCLAAHQELALQSVQVDSIETQRHQSVQILPIFGYERANAQVAAAVTGTGTAEVLLAFEFGGDTQFRLIEEAIQLGNWMRGTGGWSWGIADTFMTAFRDQLTDYSHLLVIEKTNQEGALIHLREPPTPTAVASQHNSNHTLTVLHTQPALRNYDGIGIVLIKNRDDDKIEPVITKLDSALQSVCGDTSDCRPRVHIAVTPEFSFFSELSWNDYLIELYCGATDCQATSAGGVNSPRVITAIHAAQQLAAQYRTEILLGTVAERVSVPLAEFPLGYAIYNSLLHIDSLGRLHRLRWKVADGEHETCGSLSGASYQTCVTWKTYLAALTVRRHSIMAGDKTLTYLPLICSERSRNVFLIAADLLIPRPVDLLIGPEREGDIQYENIMNDIQLRQWSAHLWGWDWGIWDTFAVNFIRHHQILKPGGHLAVTDAGFAQAALFQIFDPPTPLSTSPTVTPEWVHAKIPLR